MRKIAIIGLGLIGGSLALGLKKAGFYVIGVPHRKETIDQAKSAGAIDKGLLDPDAVKDADIVFIATPINLIIPKLKEIIPHLKRGAIVTDVGSTKQEIVVAAQKLMPKGVYFVGGHPMAGKEKVKFEAAEPGLFCGKAYIFTKTKKTNVQALNTLKEVIKMLNSKVVEMDPIAHDLAVAGISHMPLAVAASLVNSVASSSIKEKMAEIAASGFKDTTRIASGDPMLGVDMFKTNKKSVLRMISAFKKELLKLEKAINAGDKKAINSILKNAKDFRDRVIGN